MEFEGGVISALFQKANGQFAQRRRLRREERYRERSGRVADEKLVDNWFDPIETELRMKLRSVIEAMIEEEFEIALKTRSQTPSFRHYTK